ncbi:Dehydrogenase reductase SDR member 4 [Borealophlyctis nickersoniae]|nr:Dehydrogenase reductase SDR member 4 [Borealophlyctis nickersoniae]
MSTPTTPLPLTNKVAIVTGGSRGIGRSICQRLAQDGASVVVNYNTNAAEAQSVVDEINAEGRGEAVAVQADMGRLGM